MQTSSAKLRLFVGQIPREWTEEHVQALFCQFGKLEEVTILKHSDTLVSKGCAFVTFEEDEAGVRAIAELHDKYSPSEGRKIQVRDASAPRSSVETGRLYCSNLAETTNGDQIFDLFSQVGKVLSVSVLMTPWNRSKCSCLVEMGTKLDAQTVIDTFNGKFRLPDAPTEMAVTWARNTGSRNRSASSSTSSFNYPSQTQAVPYDFTTMYLPSPTAHASHQYFDLPSASPRGQQYFDLSANVSPRGNQVFDLPSSPRAQQYFDPNAYYASAPGVAYDDYLEEEKYDEGYSAPSAMAPVMDMTPYQATQQAAAMAYSQSVIFVAVPYATTSLPPGSPIVPGNQQAQGLHGPFSPKQQMSRRKSSSSLLSSPSRYVQGAAGCNLFVKNFPTDWDTSELSQLFQRYGEILSCNIFKDRVSGKSKGFGFVSFSSKDHAQAAISELNGLEIGGDTLIVETKLKDTSFQGNSLLDSADEQLNIDRTVQDQEVLL